MPSPAATERTLRAILRYVVDPRGVRDVQESTDELEMALSDLRQHFFELMEPIQDLTAVTSQFEGLTLEFQDYGRRITEPFKIFAEQYIDSAGEADDVAQRWLETTKKLEREQARFGAVAAESILPLMELTANVVEKAAAFAEEYPEIAKIAFGIGTAVVLATALTAAVGKGIRIVADVKLFALEAKRFLAAMAMRDAANKQVVAAGLMNKAAATQAGAAGAGAGGGIGGLLKGAAGGLPAMIGAAAPILAVGAAVAAVGIAGLKFKRFSEDVNKETDKMGDRWEGFFEKTAKGTSSASETLDEYRAAQRRVSVALDGMSIAADFFVDQEKLMFASTAQLSQAFVIGARDYTDYTQTINRHSEGLRKGEDRLYAVTQETFAYRRELDRLQKALMRGEASLKQVGELMAEQGSLQEKILGKFVLTLGKVQEEVALKELVQDWDDYHSSLSQGVNEFIKANMVANEEHQKGQTALSEETRKEEERIGTQWAKDTLDLDLRTATERTDILDRLGIDLVRAETDIAQERGDAAQSFYTESTEAEESYYKERTESAAEFGLDALRTEQDHQKEMRRMGEDSQDRQVDAIRRRSAGDLLTERRAYAKDRGRAEEDYTTDLARRHQDFARQIQQMEVSFREQEAAREADYAQRLAEIAAQAREEQAVLNKAAEEELTANDEARQKDIVSLHAAKEEELKTLEEGQASQEEELDRSLKEQLREAKSAHSLEIKEARDNWDQRRKDAGFYLDGELQQVQGHYQTRLSSLQAWVDQSNAVLLTLKPPSRSGGDDLGFQAGGYAGFGQHTLGEKGEEFVMTNATTRRAEKLAGSRLTQAGVLGAMAGGGAGAPSIQLSQTNNIYTDGNPDKVRIMAKQGALEALNEVLDKVN